MNTLGWSLILVLALQITACGTSGSGGDSAKQSKDSANAQAGAPAPTGVSAQAPNVLAGTWDSGCYTTEDNDYERRINTFSGGTCKSIVHFFEDATCANATYDVTITATCTFGHMTSGSQDLITIDEKPQKMTMTVIGSWVLTSLNQSASFGYSDWALNVPKDISTRRSSASDTKDPAEKMQMEYEVAKVVGGKLYPGTSDGKSSSDRATEVDMTRPYSKVQ